MIPVIENIIFNFLENKRRNLNNSIKALVIKAQQIVIHDLEMKDNKISELFKILYYNLVKSEHCSKLSGNFWWARFTVC